MPVKYIGNKSSYIGKPMFHYLANLKNFGVGRMLVKSAFERYPEQSYYIVRKVEPQMDEELIFGKVWGEHVFRGVQLPGISLFYGTYKGDFKLVPKEDEEKYKKNVSEKKPEKILPRYQPFPPVLAEIIKRRMTASGQVVDKEPMLKMKYSYSENKWYRIAEEGETPTVKFKLKINPEYLKELREH